MSDHTSDPHRIAARITRDSASNLWFVGQALTAEKRRLFEAAYASMRVIDDFVDDDFLAEDPDGRAARRESALNYVELWQRSAVDCIADHPPAAGLTERDAAVLTALRQASRDCDVPDMPWRQLGQAMTFDIREGSLEDWSDFDGYCEGATVAPATVFLYVLQAAPVNGAGLCAGLTAEELAGQARDMAVFCYLVHIMRDFAKDAARGGQLMTIPASCFVQHGTSRDALSASPQQAVSLLRDLSRRAGQRRLAARAMADSLIPSLGTVEGRILNALLTIYERMHDSLENDPSPLRERASLTASLRSALASQLGLAPP